MTTENKVVFVKVPWGVEYPYCSEHGAMNKVSAFGMWRCLECHIGYNEVTKEFFSSSNEGFRNDAKK